MSGNICLASLLMAAALLVCGPVAIATAVESPHSPDDRWCVFEPDTPGHGSEEGKKHIVLISGDEEYRSEEALPMLGKLLAKRHGFRCTVLFSLDPESGEIDPNNQVNIPGLHLLDEADLVIMALRFRQPPEQAMAHFDAYLQAGKPIIGLRTSTHAFRFPADSDNRFKKYGFNSQQWRGGFGKHVLGETWVSHHGRHGSQSTRGVVNPKQSDHPILLGVEDVWGPTDVYGIRELPDNAQVLLYGQVLSGMQPDDPPVEGKQNDPMMPLAWIRDYQAESGNTARIFCTTMGASTDFQSAGLRRLVVNAAYWALEMEDEISADSSVEIFGQYEPTPFGFNRFQTGMKPADFAK